MHFPPIRPIFHEIFTVFQVLENVNSLNCEILFTSQAISSSQLASNIVFADISLGLLSLAKTEDNLYKLHIFEKNSRSPKIM